MAESKSKHPPEIPGYTLIRVLGKGGMATVHLAHQNSVDREVALKYLSKHLLTDERFAERFLREARIAAKLHHRHVVSIYDVGVHEDQPYIAMEFLSGGPIQPEAGKPIPPEHALRCVAEIALALDYAHGKGVIHRDVKPDNILLRDDGSCVLSDFGIARMVDGNTMMTRTGAVVGTPYYMSPEQLRGKQIDGRADLYSLGVVFYQLLTGMVPYSASDSMAVGIMHMTAPMPRLPQQHARLQPLLDKMLAKEVDDRVQTGVALSQMAKSALRQVADAEDFRITAPQIAVSADTKVGVMDSTSPPQPTKRIEPVIGSVANKPAEQLPTGRKLDERGAGNKKPVANADADQRRVEPIQARPDGRSEPTMGSLGSAKPGMKFEPSFGRMDPTVASAAMRRSSDRDVAAGGAKWLLPLVILLSLAGASYYFRAPLQNWWAAKTAAAAPANQIEVLTKAQAAERAGNWFDDTQNDALSWYQLLLSKDPQHTDGKAGLQRTINALLIEAQNLLASKPARAEAILQRLRLADPGNATITTLLDRVRKNQSKPVASDPKLAQQTGVMVNGVSLDGELSAAVEKSGKDEWLGANGALAHYMRVLAMDPKNQSARSGVRSGEAIAKRQLEKAIAANNAAAVERIANEWRRAQPENNTRDLLLRKWQLSQNDNAEEATRISGWLDQADVAFNAGQITSPANTSAVDLWRRVTTLDPENTRAADGLRRAGEELMVQAEAAINSEQFDLAANLLQQSKLVGGDNLRLRELAKKLTELRANAVADAPPIVAPSIDNAQRDAMLAKVDQALDEGRLIEPPGSSAFDQLRMIEKITRDSETMRRSERLTTLLRESFQRSIDDGDFESAVSAFSGLQVMRTTGIEQMRNQLADSLTADVRAKISLEQFDAAKRRLSLLKQFMPKHPELDDLQLEILQAGG